MSKVVESAQHSAELGSEHNFGAFVQTSTISGAMKLLVWMDYPCLVAVVISSLPNTKFLNAPGVD